MKTTTVATKTGYPPVLPMWPVFLAILLAWGGPTQAETLSPATQSPSRQAVPHDLVEEAPDPDGFTPLAVGDYFTCAIPPGWDQVESAFGLSAEEKKVHGVTLQGPWRGEIPVRISLFYYGQGNLLYRSADHYLRVFSQPALGVALAGSSYGPVTSATVSGREAMRFERLKNEYGPLRDSLGEPDRQSGDDARVYEQREMMASPLSVRERFMVLPAESGFFALRYSAPAESFPEFVPLFEKVAATFHAIQ